MAQSHCDIVRASDKRTQCQDPFRSLFDQISNLYAAGLESSTSFLHCGANFLALPSEALVIAP